MTRSNLYVTLSDGEQVQCVADSSSAPEQGFIVETLLLPLLSLNNSEKELALLEKYCSMNELRVNATYRYDLNLPKKRVFFAEEIYVPRFDTFHYGEVLNDRYTAYLQQETPLETDIKQQFKHLSNEELINRTNVLPDFKWDDEGVELQRRRRVSGCTFDYEMRGNTLIILRDKRPNSKHKINHLNQQP
ncbi:hypothetical protein [Mucilaginibacter sp. UYCu711]|uniref:hypothetical protein n=1 Tax=Mucilaginibacter sp. UYCu711 TaxID=3156339 RepID=UPI003D1B2FE7